ncbi:3'3'-cGAMP-specific phosphodiesterase 1 [Lachnospiraceae bacterium]|nr:3'3'-cGAMP-specific phosphodiesterase 1 [Lachnospiraceae bacterium]
MEYIHSKDIFLFMRDTFKLVDRRAMDHGSRVAYYFYKMLECKGVYEKFELADFVFLASLHDIGAYKTDNLKDLIRYDLKEPLAHATYGYLFFKHLSPLSELATVILYHHTDYSQLELLDYGNREIAACLNLAEKVDIFSVALGDKFDIRMFRKQAGGALSEDALNLFDKAVREFDVLNKVKKGDYKEELDDIIGYMIFTNEDKRKYLEMLMYCQGFRSEKSVVNSVVCTCIAEMLGVKAGLNSLERDQLYYGAILHDIGMMAVPKEITDAPRSLTTEEYQKVKMHVHLAERILQNRMAPEVVEIVAAHHERSDGSGYPRGLREVQMNQKQQILQLADSVTALLGKRSYRSAFRESEMLGIIQEEAMNGKYNKNLANILFDNYDDIMQRVKISAEETMVTYRKLNHQFGQVSEKLKAQ